MKNVLFISHDTVMYGAPKSMLNIIDGLKDKVNFVVLVPYEGGLVDELKRRNVKVYISKYEWEQYFLKSFRDYLLFLPRLIRHYSVTSKTLLLIKKLNTEHSFDIIHSNSGVTRVGYIASKLFHIPHVWHIREFQKEDYQINILYGLSHLKKIMRKSDEVICVSHEIQNYFELENNSEVIYNGVMSNPKEEIIFSKEDYFIYASSLSAKKGIFEVLSAYKIFSQTNSSTELYICGTGSEEITKSVLKYIDEQKLTNRIKLLGYRNDVLSLMKKAKACIMASQNEAFGRTTAEAMFMGCPVIGKATGGTLEIIQNKTYGYLYNTNGELIDWMIHFTDSKNADIINSIIVAANERAREFFTQEQLCNRVFDIYNTLSQHKNI